MAGHPVTLKTTEDDDGNTVISFKERNSVPLSKVRNRVAALRAAGLMPQQTTVSHKDGYIITSIEPPMSRQSKKFAAWEILMGRTLFYMTTSIQAHYGPTATAVRVRNLR